jgi:hypothetical protein
MYFEKEDPLLLYQSILENIVWHISKLFNISIADHERLAKILPSLFEDLFLILRMGTGMSST